MCDNRYHAIKKGQKKGSIIWPFDVYVPCNKCPVCKKNRVEGWAFRMMQEEKNALSSYFVTLTYHDDYLIYSLDGKPTLDRGGYYGVNKKRYYSSHFQNYIKRLRKVQENSATIKYYMAAEYGEEGDRPHYHVILFNVIDIETIATSWGKGNVHIGSVTGGSVAYTAKYVDKDSTAGVNDLREREYSTMSKGLGASYLTDEVIKYHRSGLKTYLNDGRIKIAMPRYYKERIFKTEEEKKAIINMAALKEKEKDLDNRRKFSKLYTTEENITYDHWLYTFKQGRYKLHKRKVEKRKFDGKVKKSVTHRSYI